LTPTIPTRAANARRHPRRTVSALWWPLPAIGIAILSCLVAVPAAALGPENVLLVVNPESVESMTVANHYQALREIPATNVLYVPWEPGKHRTDIDTFRQKILLPVLRAALDPRRKPRRIDCVAYSTDFPWAIDLKPDLKRFREAAEEADRDISIPKQLTPVGSITGLTYLWQAVAAKNIAYLQLRSNLYMQRMAADDVDVPTYSFTSDTGWGADGAPIEPDDESRGRRYMLSVMLGVTAKHGNTVPEIISYLQRGAEADGNLPGGTIYLMRNSNVRSKVRHGSFYATTLQLKRLGIDAEIVDGQLPKDRLDVQGLMTGTASFNWQKSGSRIRPGAICEHLTSFGGVLDKPGQTKFSEFLRHGAAGSSGTVTEPYAIAQKFPAPMIHVHYGRGCSLVEAYYQSVAGPYQLLIVGDPLCRPWGRWPRVAVTGISGSDEVSGECRIRTSVSFPDGEELKHLEFYVDGAYRDEFGPGETIPLDTPELADGYHQLRFVAVGDGVRRLQGSQTIAIITRNHRRSVSFEEKPDGVVSASSPVRLEVIAPGSIGVAVTHNGRLVGRLSGDRGRIEIDPQRLGYGPVTLKVVGLGAGGPATNVIARPVEFTVQPPSP